MTPNIYIIYENEDWMPPLRLALKDLDLPFEGGTGSSRGQRSGCVRNGPDFVYVASSSCNNIQPKKKRFLMVNGNPMRLKMHRNYNFSSSPLYFLYIVAVLYLYIIY
jgi:hypothetical protein